MHGWQGAHAWRVRVERALHACARVPAAARASSRRRASRQASLSNARHASVCARNSDASERRELGCIREQTYAESRCVLTLDRDHFCTPTSGLRFICSPRAPPPPCSVLLIAALRCAAITAATWGARQCRHSQKPRSCKTEWKHVFLHTCCRTTMAPTNWLAHSTTRPKSATRREAPAEAMAGHL